MDKKEKLLELYSQKEAAEKNNPLLSYEKRSKLADEVGVDVMWGRFDELNKPIENIQEQIDALIKVHHPKAIDIVVNNDCWSVLVEDKQAKFSAWIDVSIDENVHDVSVDWNQYIFYNNDDDIYQKLYQENDMVCDFFTSEAISYLQEKGYIYQDENANWHKKEKTYETINH